eukprot:5921636-Prymnesium_polylepis.1
MPAYLEARYSVPWGAGPQRPRRLASATVSTYRRTRQPVKPVTPRVLLLGSSNTRGATVGIKEDIKSVGAFGVTVSPDVT